MVLLSDFQQELIARCLANDISVYSPHAALDAIAGGINDAVVDKSEWICMYNAD
jgi:putative NIF3 family GTP cyclohydrolase 1 type 2